jgi:hypothetical protein
MVFNTKIYLLHEAYPLLALKKEKRGQILHAACQKGSE